jgi:hypothetical protein
MPDQAVLAYLSAFREYAAAEAQAEQMAAALASAAEQLKYWRSLADSQPPAGGFNPEGLPDGEAVRAALAAWVAARDRLKSAWKLVPGGERVGLQPPPVSQ